MLRQQRTGCQEEDNDDLLVSILRYNKICTIRGGVQPPPYRIITSKFNIVIFFLKSCHSPISI